MNNTHASIAMGNPLRRRLLAVALMTMVGAAAMEPAYSQNKDTPRNYAVQAGDLGNALDQLASQAGMQIVYPGDLVRGKKAVAINGQQTLQDALQKLLKGTGLTWGVVNGNTIVVKQAEAPSRPAKPVPTQNKVGDTQENEAVELEKMVVTGSRIRRAEIEGPSPVIFLTREDLDRTGRATVAEALATLPQNFSPPAQVGDALIVTSQVDLRGLGSDNTLVLINGRRAANSGAGPRWFNSFTDLNSIPLSAVERIEVLTDGASAVYGSDAVAGVVNVILKKEYQGAEVSGSYGASSEGGASERRVSFAAGGKVGEVTGLLTGEYFNRGSLKATDRQFSRTADQRSKGGTDYRLTQSNPGNICALGGSLPGVGASCAGVPAGQDGRNLTPADFAATAGLFNHEDQAQYTDIIAATARWGLNGRFEWKPTGDLSLYAEAGAAHTASRPRTYPPLITALVPAGNPFNPFGQMVLTQWAATELGSRVSKSRTDNRRGVLGAEGAFGSSWNWGTSIEYSRDEFFQGSPFLRSAVVNALLNRTDPATALNVFGDGQGANTPAVLQELAQASGVQDIEGVSTLRGWEGHADGVLANWGGRELRAAIGAEYRREALNHVDEQFDTDISADRNVKAVFAELSIPLFDAEHKRPGLQALEFQLAGRAERYSDFGDTFNPRVAIRWQPVSSLALRASASTGFRAPALDEIFGPVYEIPGAPFVDPRRNNESVLVLVKTGSNPDLDPEESKSWNVGLVWDVPGVSGLSVTADYYRIWQEQRITSGFFLYFNPEFESLFPDRYLRAEPTPADVAAGLPGQVVQVDTRDINVSESSTSGVDLGLHYLKDTKVGRFDFRLNGSIVDRLEVKATPTSETESLIATTGAGLSSIGSPARARGNASVYWSRGPWELGVTERYTGASRESNTASPLFGHRYDDYYQTDVQVNYRWPEKSFLAGTRVSFSVENLFNAEPPFVDQQIGYLSTLYSPRQRFLSLTLSKAF